MSTLEDKTILIIGGSAGLGFAVAKASLLSLAAKVIIASSTIAKIQEAVRKLEVLVSEKKLPGKVVGGVLDASTVDAVKDFVTNTGEIDHLILTSGDSVPKPFLGVNLNETKNIFDVRFWGYAAAAQAANIRPGGSIILTTGAGMYKPPKNWSLSASIAGAIDSLTRGLAVDLAPIRVNAVCPGIVDTDFWKDIPQEARDALFKSSAESLLVKHIGTADECAEAYLFLMKCTFITGQRIEVDGGLRLS